MKKKVKKQRKLWFKFLKKIMRLFIKETEFIYLGDKVENNSVILSNHVGTAAPLAWELYGDVNFRFWGASEMNSGLISLYRYQSRVFYHEKKHWNLHLARLFCLIASPLTYIFYKGLNLISTYRDVRFRTTISESIRTFEKGQNLIIFPEISDEVDVMDVMEVINDDHMLHALILLRPLPEKFDERRIRSILNPAKDIEGLEWGSLAKTDDETMQKFLEAVADAATVQLAAMAEEE